MEIGARIKDIRLSKRLTQRKLADLVNITPSFLCRIEKGNATPSLAIIYSIADALDIPSQDLLANSSISSDTDLSVPEKIKIVVEKFPINRQIELLDTLEFLASRLDKL